MKGNEISLFEQGSQCNEFDAVRRQLQMGVMRDDLCAECLT